MNAWNDDPDRATIEKIVSRLREPMRLGDTFELRVMSAVHAEALVKADASLNERKTAEESIRPWWIRRYTLRFTALGGLAMAASIFGIIFLGATMLSRTSPTETAPHVATVPTGTPAATAKPKDAENVHFILVDGSARQVYLVGDFNNWSKKATPLERAANGNSWAVSVPLSHGRHEYAFIVSDENGDRWVADPLTRVVEDEFGTESSVVRVEPSEDAARATTGS